MIGKWFLNVLIGIDQLGNAIMFGDPDETISSRIGKIKRKYGGKIPWSKPVTKIIDKGLDVIDKNHSLDAIEDDEGEDQIDTTPNPDAKFPEIKTIGD
jgi:hypothetical protein